MCDTGPRIMPSARLPASNDRIGQGRAVRFQRGKTDRHFFEGQAERNDPIHLAQNMERRGHDLRPDTVARHDDEVRAIGHDARLPILRQPTIVRNRSQTFFGASARAPARMPSAITAVITACQRPAAARPAVRGPGDRGEGFGEGGDARGGLAAAEVAAPGLGAEPELDQRRGGGRDADAARGHAAHRRRGQRHGDHEAAQNTSAMPPVHRLDLGAHDEPPGSAPWRRDRARPRRRWRARRDRRRAGRPP